MKLIVLGANGGTGKRVVQEALAAGDTVTAVVRSDAKRLSVQHGELTELVGDPCDPKFLAAAFEGQDAVVSTLGGKGPTRRATSIYWKSADAIVEAALDSGLRQVAVTSTALLFPPSRLFDKLLAALVRNVVESATRMEDTLNRANLDVSVGRCGFLTNGEEPGYRAQLGSLPARGSSISRLGLARFLLESVREHGSGMRIYGVSGPI